MIFSLNTDYSGCTGSPESRLRMMGEAGFAHVLWCHQWYQDFLYSASEIAQIRRWLRDFGMAIQDIHGSAGVEKCWFSPVEYERQAGVELVLNRMRMLRELDGTGTLMMHVPAVVAGLSEEERAGRLRMEESLRRSLDELERANGWLDEAEVAEKLFEGPLRFDLSSWQPVDASKHPLPAPLMSRIFLTALANRLLGGKLAPRPIPASKLGALHRMITLDGHLHPRLREETVNWLESLVPGGGRFAQFCLRQWDEAFCPITPDKMDPRFVGGLLIAPDTD